MVQSSHLSGGSDSRLSGENAAGVLSGRTGSRSQGTELLTPSRDRPSGTPSSRGRRVQSSTPLPGQYALFDRRRFSYGNAQTPNETSFPESESVGGRTGSVTIWGTTIVAAETERRLRRFLESFTTESGIKLYPSLLQEVAARHSVSFPFDCQNLYTYDPELYDQLVRYPVEFIILLENALHAISAAGPGDQDGLDLQIHPYHLRDSKTMRQLNPCDLETLISVKGMVTRCSGIIPEMLEAVFICQSCRAEHRCQVECGKIDEPTQCDNCQQKFTLRIAHNHCQFANKQTIRLQESPDQIPEGETPHTCTVFVSDEVVDACKPGDRVTVTGVYKAAPVRVNPRNRSIKSIYKTYILGLHVEVERGASGQRDRSESASQVAEESAPDRTPVEELEALAADPDVYENLVDSIAPSVWGMRDVKRGLLCQLFGAVPKVYSGGSTRGELNVLLVGDPGVSKSQLLGYMNKIAPRGIYTSGRGSSAVGLTAYVTRDPETKEMVLESGALVLSDLGVCCIDEFDKMSDNARSMLHEVMEQQTVSVAKAGIISTLNARTSVLAAANPVESRYNRGKNIMDNINLPPSLVSRFDLLYLILDDVDEGKDRQLAKHLVSLHFESVPEPPRSRIPARKLRDLVAHARQTCHPSISDEASKAIVDAYVDMRCRGQAMGNKRTTISATPRQLESLVRIAEALARMRLSTSVEARDVEEAVRLMKSAWASAAEPSTGVLDMSLINTGVSEASRQNLKQVEQAVAEVLRKVDSRAGTLQQLGTLVEDQLGFSVPQETIAQGMQALPNVTVRGARWSKTGRAV